MIKKLLSSTLLVFTFLISHAQFNESHFIEENSETILIVNSSLLISDLDINETNKYNSLTTQLKTDIQGINSHPLERVGKILTFVGIPLAIIGGILVSDADALYYNCVNGECEGDPKGGFGVLLLAAGAGMGGTGIVLWTIGKNK